MAFTSSDDVRGRVHAYLVATGILMLLTVASALIAPRLAGNGARSMLTIGVAVGEGLVGLLLFMKLRGEGAAVRRTVALTAFLIVVTLLLPALSERFRAPGSARPIWDAGVTTPPLTAADVHKGSH